MPTQGTLDTTFNSTGVVVTDFVIGDTTNSAVNSVAIDQNNNIIVAGYITFSGISNADSALARYLPNGVLDTTFNSTGVVVTDFVSVSNSSSEILSVAIDQNNNIIVAGSVIGSGITIKDYVLARYLPNGVLDTTFNSTGVVVTDFVSNNTNSAVNSVIIDKNNNIIVAGFVNGPGISGADYALARYLPNGVLDTTFNSTGKVVTDFVSNNTNSTPSSVKIDNNNNIIVAGTVNGTGVNGYDYALVRYLPTGVLDTTFNSTGVVVTDFVSNNTNSAVNSVIIDKNNNIIVAGFVNGPGISGADYALARYLPNGVLDTTFNSTGKVVTDFVSNNTNSYIYQAKIDKNNNIIIAGFVNGPGISSADYALARYLPTGALDKNFNNTGIVVTDFVSNGDSIAKSVTIDNNNNIVVGGTSNTDYVLARYYNGLKQTDEIPVSNICFPAGTPIICNQGAIAIECLNPEIHTIRGKKIIGITKTVTQDKYLVCFEKSALQENIPSKKTIISKNHRIFYKGKMMQAKEFLNDFKNVKKVKYTGEVLYNVLMEEPDKMMVNNLICETLHPENSIAKLYKLLSHLNVEEQNELIVKFNKYVIENNVYNKKIQKL